MLTEEGKKFLEKELSKLVDKETKEKNLSSEDLQHEKKYLIEGILEDGESMAAEMGNKNVTIEYESPYKKMVEEYYDLDQPQSEVKEKEIAVVKPTQNKSFWRRLGDAIFG